jgi:hypothetical protein
LAGTFTVLTPDGQIQVTFDANTAFEGGTKADLAPGVEVTQFRNAAGNPVAAGVFFNLITDGVTTVSSRGTFAPGPPAVLSATELEIESRP